MIKFFDLNSEQIRIKDILFNKSFLEIEIYAISNAEPNRNNSCFTIESMRDGIKTFTDKPILGFFNDSGDFEQHNGQVGYDVEMGQEYWDNSKGEQILGFIRESDKKEIVERDGLTWIVCNAMVCTQYNYMQVKRLLKDKQKKVSVEVDILESEERDGIDYINKFELLGITILGSKNGVPITEGIAGAHLSVLDLIEEKNYSQQRQALTFAYKQLQENKKEADCMAEDEKGTKSALKVDKSKEAMSDTAWGDVDKTALRNRVVEASNFKTIAKDVFLDLRDGWEEGETSKLKYPVMEIKDGDTLVYNRGALAAAKGYAEKNNETEVLEKVNAIYKKLDLDEDETEKECDTSKYCEFYEDQESCDDCPDCESKKEKECDLKDVDDAAFADDEDKNKDEDKAEEEINDDSEEEHDDYVEERNMDKSETEECVENECDELKMQCDEYKARCEELESKCAEYEKLCGNYVTELNACKEKLEHCADYDDVKKALEQANCELDSIHLKEQECFILELQKKAKLSDSEIKCVKDKCLNHEFNSLQEIEKEVAFVKFQKEYNKADLQEGQHFVMDLDRKEPLQINTSSRKSISERLKDNIKK